MKSVLRSAVLTFLLIVVSSSLPVGPRSNAQEGRLLTDFTPSSADLGWYVVNDNVMGGRSQGGFVQEPGHLRFAGRTNTSGGGFSSIRTKSLDLDLSGYEGIRVRVKGDGRRYTWRITTNARRRGRLISYWAHFDTTEDVWRVVDIPFRSFTPRSRGVTLTGPELDIGRISGMGLMMYDGRDGQFTLLLDRVEAYRPVG